MRFGTIALILSLFLTGCGAGSSGGNTTDPTAERIDTPAAPAGVDIRGSITLISPPSNQSSVMLVEGAKEPDTRYDKASIEITAQTAILRKDGSTVSPAGIEQLQQGQRVEVVFSGPVRESYPVQATAAQITILP